MSNDVAYRIYWVKANMSNEEWRKYYEIRTGPDDMEVMLIVPSFDKIYEVFVKNYPNLPVSGITSVEKMVMPVAY